MKFYTGSAGILARKAQIEPMLGRPLHAFKASMQLAQDDVLVGWGQKANTRQIKQKAHERGLPYWQLEDGFIGYIGHPARGGKAVSLIADPVGIYYDARQPSRLEQLIATPCDARMVARAEALTRELLRLGITKYNCYAADSGLPDALAARLHNDPRPKVLLIDQVAGDLSIPGALAATEDFEAMVAAARRNHPGARLLLRTHPDTRLGKKRGVLAQMQLDDVERVTDHCHPHALLNEVEAVYTVSSQMGFEALLLGKAVYCFGMPFYAGWGLTHDSKTCPRRQAQVSLPLCAPSASRWPPSCTLCAPRLPSWQTTSRCWSGAAATLNWRTRSAWKMALSAPGGWVRICAVLPRSPSTRWGSILTAAVRAGWNNCLISSRSASRSWNAVLRWWICSASMGSANITSVPCSPSRRQVTGVRWCWWWARWMAMPRS